MPTIDPRTLENQPLVLKTIAVGDFSVLCVGRLVGRIMRSDIAGGAESWLWTVTGPYLPEALRPSDCRASSLEEAKAAFWGKFDAWFAWALERPTGSAWHGDTGQSVSHRYRSASHNCCESTLVDRQRRNR